VSIGILSAVGAFNIEVEPEKWHWNSLTHRATVTNKIHPGKIIRDIKIENMGGCGTTVKEE
jgi:hypothetical protein